jgi:hypothetical protein
MLALQNSRLAKKQFQLLLPPRLRKLNKLMLLICSRRRSRVQNTALRCAPRCSPLPPWKAAKKEARAH